MRAKLRRAALWTLGFLVVAFVLLCFPFNPPKLTAAEISHRADLINEKAGIVTPHQQLGKKIRAANLALFEKVERGEPLTAEESAAYRVLYQAILKDNQRLLAKLDHELTVLTNFRLDEKNNVGTQGIEGAHDHHDASAGANLAALRQDLEDLEKADGIFASVKRVRAAIGAYKDLDDVILHMATAPQTKSVPRATESAGDDMAVRFESLMFHFKRAQFEPVNSPAYVNEVHSALDNYSLLVAAVQDRVYAHLGPVERSLSGRWGEWRSLTPSLRGITTDRIPRTTPVAQN